MSERYFPTKNQVGAQDIERGLSGLRTSLTKSTAVFVADDPDEWTGDPPTTIGEAINRIVTAMIAHGSGLP